MKNIDDVVNELNGLRDVQLDILKDTLDDNKKSNKRLWFVIVLLIISLVGTFIYYQYTVKDLLSSMEFETIEETYDVKQDNTDSDYNKLSIK